MPSVIYDPLPTNTPDRSFIKVEHSPDPAKVGATMRTVTIVADTIEVATAAWTAIRAIHPNADFDPIKRDPITSGRWIARFYLYEG